MATKLLPLMAYAAAILLLSPFQGTQAQSRSGVEQQNLAKGYILIEHEVPTRAIIDVLKPYSLVTRPLLELYGGKFIVSGGKNRETLEGEWLPPFMVILEFPSYEKARAFYYSEEYQAVLSIRLEALKGSRAILVEGRMG
ncbi:MAG: DUF1330 domain-containing protein [Rhodospirillaceae bacterium]